MNGRFEQLVVEHCSPTLAGAKPANIFFYRAQSTAEICSAVSFWNRELLKRGLRVRIMKGCCKTGRYLVYIYRENQINSILSDSEVRDFLRETGYDVSQNNGEILRQLSHRLCLCRDFPHELGVFLGYPLSDVKGFILNKGKNFTYSGLWKSYGDPDEAKRLFSEYKRCTERCKQLFANGASISELVCAA